MPTPTPELLSDPTFVKAMNALLDNAFFCNTPIMDILKRSRPKFGKVREVHAARARKLRRRGEHVHFLRWEHGHCIYGWGGGTRDTIVFKLMPGKKSEPAIMYQQIDYRSMFLPVQTGYSG